MKCFFLAAAALVFVAPARAHIGSPTVVFDGSAGPYSVRVIVRPPPVVPGRAEIDVRLLQDASDAIQVTVLPVNGWAGLKGAPAPDLAVPVRGEPGLRHAELWLMTSGSYSVHVTVAGDRGSGTVIVPVLSIATRRLAMAPWLTALLGVLGGVLFTGAVTLVGIGIRDSVVEEDALRTVRQKRFGLVATFLALVVFGLGIYQGKRWWDDEDRNYRNNQLYQPLPLGATYREAGERSAIGLAVPRDPKRGSELIPDHGKLMHLFMIREPELDALAHLHPTRSGRNSFEVAAPPLPRGRYRLYADITYQDGFAATLTTTVDLPAEMGRVAAGAEPARVDARDPDDSWFVGTPASDEKNSAVLRRTGPAEIRAGEDVTLNFAAKDASGRAIELESYMGMLGHAAVRRSDGSVFAHIHPVGTISMASQMYFVTAAARQTGQPAPIDHSMHEMHAGNDGTISFPYSFPQSGSYRIWVQTKIQGKVVTGAFDVAVSPAR